MCRSQGGARPRGPRPGAGILKVRDAAVLPCRQSGTYRIGARRRPRRPGRAVMGAEAGRRPPQGSTILVFEAALGLAVVAHGGLQPAELRAHAGLGLAIAL